MTSYRGRIAPSPTGFLHLGHGRTFSIAHRRCVEAGGTLVLRMEDLDLRRCRPEFVQGALDDLAWMGIECAEGPFYQSRRRDVFLAAWDRLRRAGWIYPCTRSRKDVQSAAGAPHDEDDAEPVFPAAWRTPVEEALRQDSPAGVNWRFRVPDGRVVAFTDLRAGPRRYVAGEDFGDFLVWNRDDVPAYELAVVADDIDMRITEVVRGEDLLKSTARQLLVYEALGAPPPAFYHTPLVRDANGVRLAKRNDALAMKTWRERGCGFAQALASAIS